MTNNVCVQFLTSDEPDENEEREHSIKERIALVKAPALYDAAHSY